MEILAYCPTFPHICIRPFSSSSSSSAALIPDSARRLRALGPPGPALPARSCLFLSVTFMHVIIDCVYCDGPIYHLQPPVGLQACCCHCSSRAVAGIHLSWPACMFPCQISPVWGIPTSTTLTLIFPSIKKKNYIIPANHLQLLLLESMEYLLLKQTSSAPVLICGAPRQPPAFAACCCSPPGPPKRASPALFSPPPLLRGAGRGPNGGKQIIYKHVP